MSTQRRSAADKRIASKTFCPSYPSANVPGAGSLAACLPWIRSRMISKSFVHAAGFDLAPYTKLCGIMRDRIQGKQASSDPAPGTFADGYEGQKVLDAIRLSAAERRWVDID